MRKFVNELPGLGAGAANNLGQYIPVAVPDTTTYPGTDYYIIELVEYTEQMHSDLPPTTLRGYRQAGGPANYLGPAIVAQKDRPVRILFRNLLPTGAGGNLFIPVDSTVMGSGPTPAGHEWMMMNPDLVDPQNPMCSGPGKDAARGRRVSASPTTGLSSTCTAASHPGSATARRTSGSRPPARTPPTRRAPACGLCRICQTMAMPPMAR